MSDSEISGRAVALMGRLARARYGADDAIAFAQTHLSKALQEWVTGYEGDLAAVVDSIQDGYIPSRQLGVGPPPEAHYNLAQLFLRSIARGLLRDEDPERTSRPGAKEAPEAVQMLGALRTELEACGYEYLNGDLVARGNALPAEAEQRHIFGELLAQAELPHSTEIANRFSDAEHDLVKGDLKGVGHNVRLATDRVLEDIVASASARRVDKHGSGWTGMVDYLMAAGALGRVESGHGKDTAEAALLRGYYRYVSVEGSHVGIPAPHDAASVLRLGYFIAAHLIEKFLDWRGRSFVDYKID